MGKHDRDRDEQFRLGALAGLARKSEDSGNQSRVQDRLREGYQADLVHEQMRPMRLDTPLVSVDRPSRRRLEPAEFSVRQSRSDEDGGVKAGAEHDAVRHELSERGD